MRFTRRPLRCLRSNEARSQWRIYMKFEISTRHGLHHHRDNKKNILKVKSLISKINCTILPSVASKWADWNCHHCKSFRRGSTSTCETDITAVILPWDVRKGYMIFGTPSHTSFPRWDDSIHSHCSYGKRQVSGFSYLRWQIHGQFARQGTHLWSR